MRTIPYFLLLALAIPMSCFSQRLGDINIDKNKDKVFTNIPEALKQPNRVYHLDLSGQKLTEIPSEVTRLPRLLSLDLSKNQLRSIDRIPWDQLSKLEAVNLYDNQLTEFPTPLLACRNLTELNVGLNNIGSLPENISGWKFLNVLKVHQNYINKLPQDWSFRELREIRLDGNSIKWLPESFFTENPRLVNLNLNGNAVLKLPASITQSNLTRLDLGGNNISNPELVGQLTDLEFLVLDWIPLDPTAIDALTNLRQIEILSLENCRIQSLPDSIENWKKLRELSLINNQIQQIPPELWSLRRLEKLWLQYNSIDVDALIVPESVTVYY